jgi:hypothetical protein
MTRISLNLSYGCYYVQGNSLFKGNWKTSLLRFFIPTYASNQDKKVSAFFTQYFKEILGKEIGVAEEQKTKAMLSLAEQHIARGKKRFFCPSPEISRLECYTLAARERLKLFGPQHSRASLNEQCRLDNQSLLKRWKGLGFPEESFWSCPDLVDFIFETHLHRHIRHVDYQHTIQMHPVLARCNGQTYFVSEPHLMMNGRMRPWSKISEQIAVDKEGRLHSKGPRGEKIYWIYLEQGLIQRDRHDFDKLHPFKTLANVPNSCQVQVVTSHFSGKRWLPWHYLTKGSVHTHFRIIPRTGFSSAHPTSELEDGKVYSIGYGARWDDVAKRQPLKTIPGLFYSPDSTEFFKEDLLITTLDNVTDERMLKLVKVTKKHAKELWPFNIAKRNCCSGTTELLKEAGVIDLRSEIRADHFLYKIFCPKLIRKGLAALSGQLAKVIPEKVSKVLSYAAFLPVAIMLSPLLLALGAWRSKRPDSKDKRQGQLTPMISKIADVFDPSKFTVNMTMNVFKWQKKQPNTVYIKQ